LPHDPSSPADEIALIGLPSEIPPTSSGHISISTQNNSSFGEDTFEEPPPPTSFINGIEAYEIESIIGQRRHPANVKPKNKRGKMKLLVKWKGYAENQATWEWEDDLREDLGDDVLYDLLDQFLMQETKRRKALRRKSSKQIGPQRKRLKKSSQSGSQKYSHQKLGSLQIMEPSSQTPLRGSTKTAVDQIEAQPPPQDKDKTLPVEFSFIPDSFSTVHLSDDDVGDELVKRKLVHTTDSIAEVQVKGSFFTPVILEEEEPGQAIPSQQPLSGHIDEGAEEEEWDYVLPASQLWKETSGLSQLAELPGSLSSVALTDELSDLLAVPKKSHTPPSSPPSAKTLRLANRKRCPPTESPFQTPRKKLKYSDVQPPRAPPSPRESKPQTAEEYNAILLSNPRVRDATALNPDFLRKYFQESRLHHLATWKAELRARMQERALSSSEPSLKDRASRWVMHVDFDCFFAAVSTRDRPELKDKPVAITHGNSANSTSSEIASCNYAARKFGVKNGNWLGHAKKLCPDLICLGYDFKQYEEASEAFYGVILSIGV
jgi:DNA repair protein REV1